MKQLQLFSESEISEGTTRFSLNSKPIKMSTADTTDKFIIANAMNPLTKLMYWAGKLKSQTPAK